MELLAQPHRSGVLQVLSDVLGVTMLVDAINNRRSRGGSENSVLGPFFREDRPRLDAGADLSAGQAGTRMHVRSRVVDDAGRPVPGAQVDVWHSDSAGHYDSDVPGLDGPAMRGLLQTDADGRFSFWSIAPGPYPIPGDGTVGELMRVLDRPLMRPAHVHVRITAPGFGTVTTMLFRDDDPHLEADPVFGTKRSLLARFEKHEDRDGPFELVEHVFVLEPAGAGEH